MGKFSNAKKILSLVLGLMSSGTFGVSARTKNKKIDAAASRSAKSKNSNKIKKGNKKGNGKNNKKSAGANNKMRKRALGADDVRMKRGKGAQGSFFVGKNGKIKPLNTYGTLVGGGLLTLAGGYGLGKIGTVSQSEHDDVLDANSKLRGSNDKLRAKINELEAKLALMVPGGKFGDVFGQKVKGKVNENIGDPETIKNLASEAWSIEKNEKKGNKKFAAGRLAQNIKLAFPGYFTEDILRMSSNEFELYLLCRIVKDTLGEGGLLSYEPGQKCRISAGLNSGKSINFGVSPKNYKFSWEIEGDYSKVTGCIAPKGTSDMSASGLGFFKGNAIDIAAKMYGGIDCAVFDQFFGYTRKRLLFGGYSKFIRDILVNRYGIIDDDDFSDVWYLLAQSNNKSQEYWDFKGMMYREKGIMLSPEEKLKKQGFEQYSMKTLKQALCLMDFFMNVRLLESFVSAGANGGSYSKKVPQAGIAVPALYVGANELDDEDLDVPDKARGILNEILKNVKDKLPNYGIGNLLDTNNL